MNEDIPNTGYFDFPPITQVSGEELRILIYNKIPLVEGINLKYDEVDKDAYYMIFENKAYKEV